MSPPVGPSDHVPGGPSGPKGPRLARGSGASRRGAGRPRDTALVHRLLTEVFLRSRPEIEAALVKAFTSPETVLECVELMARLEGDLP